MSAEDVLEYEFLAQAYKTAEQQIELSAKMYADNPRLLDMLSPGRPTRLSSLPPKELLPILACYLAAELQGTSRFIDANIINLKGALRYVESLMVAGQKP